MRRRALQMSLFLTLGCGMTRDSRTQELQDQDTGLEGPTLPDGYASLIDDLVRTHQEVFDRFVLFTISGEDCEYPYPEQYGPAELTFQPDVYPYPDITGTFHFIAEMSADDGQDQWAMSTTYTDLTAGVALSSGKRPRIDGEGSWTVRLPGRNHTLDARISTGQTQEIPLSLRFKIGAYRPDGYRFDVTGSVDNVAVETSVETRTLCDTDG